MSNQGAMTHEQMLNKMGIGKDDFHDYLKKYSDFFGNLNACQQEFHRRNVPARTFDDIAMSLGPNAKPEHVEALFAEASVSGGVLPIACCR